jgi:RNA polymerase-interacting CarD/CdnL/TRCF family regulator
MDFQVGETVIHWNYGLGKIVQIDEKLLSGSPTSCYVVEIRDLTIWIPVAQAGNSTLRLPTSKSDFKKLFAILRSPGKPLPEDRMERRLYMVDKMKERNLATICEVIRDLSLYCVTKKLNENDKTALEHARNLLISEWRQTFSLSQVQVEKELVGLLGDHLPPVRPVLRPHL